MIRKILRGFLERDLELPVVLKFISRVKGNSHSFCMAEVGCGFGRYLLEFKKRGIACIGVEKNPAIIERNLQNGLHCISSEKFLSHQATYDAILLAHVIEHFSPDHLLIFMDEVLDRLKPGGHLIICTPLPSFYFFDDFDHIKPYQPTGIKMVFGEEKSQVQYYARNKLRLKDIWFRKSYRRIHYAKGRYIRSIGSWALVLSDIMSAFIFYLSFGLLGKTTGWVGVYQKV